jgi:UDP-N-acetylglucosamine 2-epimerase (non-hydrolysing)
LRIVDIIAGARPNFVKVASIIHAFLSQSGNGGNLSYRLVHTGQHYGDQMSSDFFRQLEIPRPDVNFEVGSGTHSEQTAKIMMSYERLLTNSKSDLCLVVGDVNSTMACALTAKKCGVPVAHVEAGIRSYDWAMPEEINRVVTDSISDYFFTTSLNAGRNLIGAGAPKEKIYFVGNTMIDTLLRNINHLRPPNFWEQLNLSEGKFFVLTIHRPNNVDSLDNLQCLLEKIEENSGGFPVVFPVHPRTAKILKDAIKTYSNIKLVGPQPYLEFNYLVKHAAAVITDSGGITEEATVLGVPCMTLRDSTERPETVDVGSNEIIGTRPESIKKYLEKLHSRSWKKSSVPDLWDGRAGERIVKILRDIII